MKPARLHRLAEKELAKQSRYYNRRSAGLGEDFLEKVALALASIPKHPEQARPGERGTSFFRIDRFPFRIVFIERAEEYFVFAIAHAKRRGGYWRRRLTNP